MSKKVQNNSIPKIIHYCWFGRGEKSKFIYKCIESWKKVLPDYKLVEWNEDNFNIEYNLYVRQAYDNKKYAFVSDVVRLYALYNFGGIYFDTDIEVRKSLDEYLDIADTIMAFESNNVIMTGFIAARKGSKFIEDWLHQYDGLRFVKDDGSFDLTPNTFRITEILERQGLKLTGKKQILSNNVMVYPKEVFGAYDVDNSAFVTSVDTVVVHHCMASWSTKKYKVKDFMKRTMAKILGIERYSNLRMNFKSWKNGGDL